MTLDPVFKTKQFKMWEQAISHIRFVLVLR